MSRSSGFKGLLPVSFIVILPVSSSLILKFNTNTMYPSTLHNITSQQYSTFYLYKLSERDASCASSLSASFVIGTITFFPVNSKKNSSSSSGVTVRNAIIQKSKVICTSVVCLYHNIELHEVRVTKIK